MVESSSTPAPSEREACSNGAATALTDVMTTEPDHRPIYDSGAVAYDQLVSAEDVDGNLSALLADVVTWAGARVVEIGAGTGRVTRILSGLGASVVATEPAAAMIELAVHHLAADPNVGFSRADAADLPFGDDSFDVAIAGWVFAHKRQWQPTAWRQTVSGFVAEARRVVRSDGQVVLIETLGTGFETPTPPPDLAEYYAWLEAEHGFVRQWIRTDYQFDSVDDAATVTGAFFGADFAATVGRNQWRRVPECTGVWIG